MQLKRARITHFRSLREVSVEFGSYTSFIGPNGAGKSSILKALERFYATAKSLDPDDFFARDQSVPIEIELTFGDLNEEENRTFESRVRDGRLVVTRVFDTSPSSGRYYGSVPQNRDFLPIRSQTSANPKREAYRELKSRNPVYAGLPTASSAAAVDSALAEWETQHPEALTLERDDGQFFGFQNAGRGALQRHTSFVFVPAVREAATDAADSKSSPIGRLLEILVRSSILKREEVQRFQQEVAARYKEIVSPENLPELGLLAGDLTRDLRELYSSAAVGLDWREAGEIPIPLPAADVTLSDEGFGGPVDRQGHGLQRAFVFTLLQHLARASMLPSDEAATEEDGTPVAHTAPNLILAIEEPELYQHPTRQRHLATVLRRLSIRALPGAAGATQIAFASHSPLFVSLTNADEIRLVRRTDCEGMDLKQCELRSLDLDAVARKLEKATGKPEGSFSVETLKPRLHILGTELAEGFFADGVVLVEGRSDKAALFATARTLRLDFEAAGIAVLPVEGKNNLDRPFLIFRELGIPIYTIWDCDCKTGDHKSSVNLALNRLMRPDIEIDQPSEETFVGNDYAHFSVNCEATMREELGSSIYESGLAAACRPFGFDPSKDAQKIPDVMYSLLAAAAEKGQRSQTLEEIVKAIWLHLKGVVVPSIESVVAIPIYASADVVGTTSAARQNDASEASS
jgi:putative ATP-dependent endonuclease of the OLD family